MLRSRPEHQDSYLVEGEVSQTAQATEQDSLPSNAGSGAHREAPICCGLDGSEDAIRRQPIGAPSNGTFGTVPHVDMAAR